QRHRHDHVDPSTTTAYVIQRSAEPARNALTQINLVTVLKVVNDLANNPATAVCGNGRVEVNGTMGAIGAGEFTGNRAFEWFGAFLAKRRYNADDLCFALITEILAGSNICSTDLADRWIEKRCDSPQPIKLWKRDHISSRFASTPTSNRLRRAGQFPRADSFPAEGEQAFLGAPPG